MPLPGVRVLAWLAALFLLAAGAFAGAQELQAVPQLSAHVTDQTGTLSADERARLEAKLTAFEAGKGAQIAVLLVPTIKPETIEQYSIRAAEAWKLGRKGVDDGVLLVIAKQDKKLRIEVGYGLEGALNDATAKRIISEQITPRFKQGDFYGGIDAGLDVVIRVVGGEALPPAKAKADAGSAPAGSEDSISLLIFGGFVLVFVVGGFLRAIFGRFLGAGMVGGAAGVIAWLVLSSMLVAGLIGLLLFIISLIVGSSGRGWSSGGGSWGGGSSSSGGFSGGGGSFGGGGASGDW